MTVVRGVALLLAVAAAASTRLAAQDLTADVTGYESGSTRTGWRIGVGGPLTDPIGFRLYAIHQSSAEAVVGSDYGAGGDITLFERGRAGPYLVGGLQLGARDRAGSDDVAGLDGWWSWSAGLGYEMIPLSFFALRTEGRYRSMRPGPERGFELSLGFAIRINARRPPPQRSYTEERRMAAPSEGRVVDLATAEGITRDKAELVAGVVETASGAMGTPYQWGGTGANGGGFDCSGLIQYAYKQHGVQLPRVSRDQARVGVAVEKRMESLAPGDILTFANSGSQVTHVALYVGEGKFIHSANGGVQMSLLSPTDSYGKWWYKRWVGARRVVR